MTSSTDASNSTKTAIVTGACSGIGLAVTRHLLSKSLPQWRVVLADINSQAYDAIKSTLDPSRHLYVQTDVTSWESNASLFAQAYDWSNERIDFFHANAGTGDKEIIWLPIDLDSPPQKPDLACINVITIAVLYGLKLFVYYTRKTRRTLSTSSQEQSTAGTSFEPKMVITASSAGQYPFPISPQYATGKAACVNLTRSAAPFLRRQDDIALNCLMPGFVATPIMPPALIEMWREDWVTPTSTVCRAVDECISPTGRVERDGRSDGRDGEVKVGQSVEVVRDRLYYRTHAPFADESQEFVIKESYPGGIWERVMMEAIAARTAGGGGGGKPRE